MSGNGSVVCIPRPTKTGKDPMKYPLRRVFKHAALGLLLALFTSASTGEPFGDYAQSANVGEFTVKWRPVHEPGKGGEVIEIFDSVATKGGNSSTTKRVYRFFDSSYWTYLDTVSSWNAPLAGNRPDQAGIILTLSYSVGMDKTFIILAKTRHGFREVFSGLSERIGDGAFDIMIWPTSI